MNSYIVGITGGSGAGKSTVCYKLIDDYPELFEVVNLDDYQKKKTDKNLPMLQGKINWDHPDIIDWQKLIKDVEALHSGKTVSLDVWSHRSNPNYAKHGNMIARSISPSPIILLEGYLALYNSELNKLYAMKIYLDIDEETRNKRRDKNSVIADPEYEKQVLIPMHKKYVEPTKSAADKIIDVSDLTVEDVSKIIYDDALKLLREK